jgi:YegS/Rv2252/BmrU family lipid kinase
MSFRTCVIANPASANGATGRRWPEIESALNRVLEHWERRFTEKPLHAVELARHAVEDGFDMLVSIGGDGTMNEVVTGLFDSRGEGALLRPGVVLATVRQGTGGDFARLLGQPRDLPASVAHLAGESARPCDLGFARFEDHDGRSAWRGFLNIASFGLSGEVVARVNAASKALGGRVSFLLGLVRALVGYSPLPVKVRVDGASFHEGPMITCAIANGQYFGGGMRFAPRAEIDDGRFEVVLQQKRGLKEILAIGDLYSGKSIDWPSVRSTRGEFVEAESVGPARVLVEIDGEQPGRLPASFRVLPAAVRLKQAR